MTTTRGTLGLEVFADRCEHGYHRTAQTCAECVDYGTDGAIQVALRTGMPLDLARETAAALKADGIARAEAAADPDVRAMVDEEIRRAAASGRVFTANDFRHQLPDDVGPLMGARFNAAAKAGLIVRVGYESSTKASTHAHPIAQWRAAS